MKPNIPMCVFYAAWVYAWKERGGGLLLAYPFEIPPGPIYRRGVIWALLGIFHAVNCFQTWRIITVWYATFNIFNHFIWGYQDHDILLLIIVSEVVEIMILYLNIKYWRFFRVNSLIVLLNFAMLLYNDINVFSVFSTFSILTHCVEF